MIALQQERIKEADATDRVDWLQGDARVIGLEGASFDLLVMAYFLDSFSDSQVDEYLPGWLAAVRPGGLVYYVDFVLPETGVRRLRALGMSLVMHVFFGLLTGLSNRSLVDVRSRLKELGLNRVAAWSGNRGFLVCELYQASRGNRDGSEMKTEADGLRERSQ